MKVKNNIETKNYLQIQKRVKQLKSFYIHFFVYAFVNTMIIIGKMVNNLYNGETFSQSFFEIETFSTAVLWGIGLAIHAFNVFAMNIFFKKSWEDRKIKEFIEKEKQHYKSIQK